MLRDELRRGDQAFLYHSSCAVPGIVAVMQIVKKGYPDRTAFDRKHHHYDPDSDPGNPRWFMVDVQLRRRLARTIALEELRAHAGKELKDMVLLRPGNRLSITPVEAAHWKFILSLE
jgi:predicted RNA-binding protein with PUA-like domain